MAKNVSKKVFPLYPVDMRGFEKTFCQLTLGNSWGINLATHTQAPERERLGLFSFGAKVALRPYAKVPLTLPEQVQHLQHKGLIISDPAHAYMVLARVGLYRFKGYLLHFKTQSGYQSGVAFGEIEELIQFDEALKLHILRALPLVEVGIRQAINQHMLERYGVRWYTNAELFAAPNAYFDHAEFLSRVLQEFHKMPDLFVSHYRDKYNPSQPPPAWMIAETMTLGSWSKLFEALKSQDDKDQIARQFDVKASTLTSWLHALTVVRNICAHHSRLYDRTLNTMALADDKRTKRLLRQNSFIEQDTGAQRLAPRLYALHRLTRALDPRTTWVSDLKTLLAPTPAPLLARVGFRVGWDIQSEWA